MNRIYKVIWSKVKHQYVVVSELAHSNGKQSRTARKSLRSRIAALVVCGAIAAFGVFGMMEQQAFAADIEYDREVVTGEEGVAQATNGQYVAIKTTETNSNKTATFTDADNKSYSYHLEKLDGVGNYWVRDGYSISAITGENAKYYPGADKDVRIITHKNGAVESVDAGLLKTGQVMIEGSKNADGDFITTYTGSVLNDVTAGTYVGVTNEGGTQTPGDWNYIIKDSNGEFVDVNAEGSTAKFIEAEKQADGTYTVNGQPVSTDNLYVIGDVTYTEKSYGPWKETIRNINYRLGAFLTTAGEVYKGKVFGKNNEVLMTKKESDGTYYSYWSALSNDPDEALNLTVEKFNTGIKAVDDNSRMLAEYDIDRIDVRANDENSGGQIGLLRRGKYNTDTGKWEGEYYTPGSITVENTGGENGSGDDLKIKFSNSDEEGTVHSFDVEAGSKVEASEVSNGKVTQLKINGEAYNIGGGSSVTSGYVNSEGDVYIKQDGDAPDSKGILIGRIKVTGEDGIDVTPSVEDGGKTLKYTVSGAGLADTNLSNLTEAGKTEIKSLEKHIKPGNYTIGANGDVTMTYVDGNNEDVKGQAIIKGVASQTYVDGKDALNVKYDSAEKTSVTLGKDGNKTQIHNVAAGTDDYDAVNFKQLQDVAGAEDYVKEGTINTSTGVIKLTRQLGGEITIKGLQDYVNGKDSYVTNATLEGNTLKITQNNQGKPFNIDLSGLTSGLSSSDYQVVANPNSINGEYSVSEDGKVELTVQNGTNEEDRRTVTISDVASTGALNNATNTLNQKIDNQYTTVTNEYKTYVDGKDALNVKYDSTDKTSITLGKDGNKTQIHNVAAGTDDYDAVNFKQLQDVAGAEDYVKEGTINTSTGVIKLTRQLGGEITIKGLQDYVNGKDSYVTNATLEGNTLKITQNNQGKPFNIDLSGLTSGLSSSDYQLVADPSGEYKVSADGKLTLKVQDMNNPEAQPEDVAISGIAQKDYVDGQFNSIDNSITNIEGDITEINTTVDTHDQKLKHIEHHDGILGIGDYTTVEGTDFYNDGSISSKVDSILNNTTNSFDFNRNGGSFTTEKESGTGMPLVGGTKTTTTDKAEFNEDGATFTNKTTTEEYHFLQPTEKTEITSSTNIKGGTITISSSARDDGKDIVINGNTGEMSGLSNTTLDVDGFAKSNRAATEEQLQLAMSQAGENAAKGDTYLHNGTEQIITDKGTVTGYKVNEDGTVTMTVANADGTKSRDSVVIGNVASKTALDSVTETVNAGWTATAGGNPIAVNPKDGTKLGFAGDENITVTADGTSRQIKVGLSDDITLGDYNDGTGTGVFIGGTSGTISVTNGISVGVDPNNEQKGIVIGGGKSDSIVGLDNIEWKNDADWQKDNIQADRAATEGQLQSAIQQTEAYVNKGWNAAASDGGDPINVKPGDTLNFVGGKNVDVTTENGAVNVALEDDVVLGNEDLYKNYIHLDGNNGTADFNNVVEDENTRTTHNITFDENGATFTREDGIIGDDGIYRGEKTFTTIDGGTVTVSKGSDGMTVINGGNIDTNKVAGLSNTDWNDRIAKEVAADTAGTGAASVAATQGQLKDVADMAGSAAEEAGKHTTVKKGDNNLVITSGVNEAGGSEYTISLNDNILLGDMNTSGVMINGTNGTIAVTNGFTVGSTTVNDGKIIGLANVDWSPEQTRTDEDLYDASQGATQGQLDDLYSSVVGYDINEDGTINYNSITLGNGSATEYKGKDGGGVRLTNVAYAGNITDSAGNVVGSAAVNVDYLNDTIKNSASGGEIAENEKHLATNVGETADRAGVTYAPDDTGKVTIEEVNGNGEFTGNSVVISDVASKQELDSVKDNIGDMDFSDTNYIKGDTNLTDAVVDLDGAIKDTNDRIDSLDDKIDGVSNNSIAGGKINEDTGKIDLIKNDGTAIEMEGQLTDSEVTGATFENNTLTINSTDKYDSTKTSSVSVSGIASTDDVTQAKTDITNIIGGNSSTEITNKYEEAGLTDSEGNAPGTLVDADITLNNRIQNVANTSYANDMYLNERINNVENRLGDVEERIDKVGAMAAAIANLRTMGYDPEAPTEIAVGVGQYKSETGLALGIFHYPNQDFMLSASISTSGDEVMGGIGATWKLGRKSAEERAKDEEERILAKAEEIKQAAKRAEVKAQADRHAQLLAEREAAGEPIRPVEEA